MSRLGRFWGLPGADQALLIEASFCLGVARLAIKFLPFRWIKRGWGGSQATLPGKTEAATSAFLERISRAVATASRHLPWDCSCLAQAMAGKAMLKRRGIPSTLYMGLTTDGEARVRGHAWLKCGEQVLTGRQGMEGFAVIAAFAEDEKEDQR
jgi:hypothetical protein